MDKIRVFISAVRSRFNLLLLSLFPFADQIATFALAHLAEFSEFIPVNVYKWVGFVLVLYGAIRDEIKKRAAPSVTP